MWGTVCDHDWDMNDAMVVCQELACGRARRAPTFHHFGMGEGLILLDHVSCLGNETSLLSCSAAQTGVHDCHHLEDASVVCSGTRLRSPTNRSLVPAFLTNQSLIAAFTLPPIRVQ